MGAFSARVYPFPVKLELYGLGWTQPQLKAAQTASPRPSALGWEAVSRESASLPLGDWIGLDPVGVTHGHGYVHPAPDAPKKAGGGRDRTSRAGLRGAGGPVDDRSH